MTNPTSLPRIGIYGSDGSPGPDSRGFALWPVGYNGAVTAAGGTPIVLRELSAGDCWKEILHGIDGVVLTERTAAVQRQETEEEGLAKYCRQYSVPLLAIDLGMHILNAAHSGTLYQDLSRELPESLQHRHPPEKGLRHAITVDDGTRLAALYGEGEVVVNSEHRQAVQRIGRGFRVSARALDGVVEAIEFENEKWFALGIQWHPASASASGLDIQLFRGLVNACLAKSQAPTCAAA